MISGTQFEQGEIVLVPFPFTDLSSIKKRPVLVLSTNEYNRKHEDIITCGITSNLKDKECSILLINEELVRGILPKESRIKVDKLFTLEKGIVQKKFGKVKPIIISEVRKELIRII